MKEAAFNINGTTLYTFTNENLNSFCLAFYVRAGSIYEQDDENGVTHLLEHMIFRNLKKKFNGSFYDLLALNALDFSACTYKEFLYFYIEGAVSGFDFACEVICSVFDELNVDRTEYQFEKRRIKAEIREKDQRNSIHYQFRKRVWEQTTAEKTILGYCKVLDRTSLAKLEQFRRKAFSAGNCFFYVTGNVSEEDICKLKDKIVALNIEQKPLKRKNIIQGTGSFFNRDGVVKVKDSNYYSLCFSFDVDMKKNSAGVYELIYKILFTCENALLFQHLSENDPLIYSYDSTFEQYDNVGNMYFDFDIVPDDMEKSVSRVVDVLNMLKQGNFNFEANLHYELSSWRRLLDNPTNLNWNLAYYNHLLQAHEVCYEHDLLGLLDNVTKESIMIAARDIFRTQNLTFLAEGKKSKINTQHLSNILSRLDAPV